VLINSTLPKVMVDWLTVLHLIREVAGSNLGLETEYID
jgi:hypothetical protein